jgi:hypothetical protein
MGAMDAATVLEQLWTRIDAADWAGMADLLHPDLEVAFSHTGETFDRDGFVRLNADYPGRWRCTLEELVGSGDRAVSRVRLSGTGDDVYVAASFAQVQDGLVRTLTEVWCTQEEPGPRPS